MKGLTDEQVNHISDLLQGKQPVLTEFKRVRKESKSYGTSPSGVRNRRRKDIPSHDFQESEDSFYGPGEEELLVLNLRIISGIGRR